MTWFWLALLTALSVALRDVSMRRFRALSAADCAALECLFTLPPLLLLLALVPRPELDLVFFWTFALSIPLNLAAYLLYLEAIKSSPISLSVPFLAFTPVFMIMTGQLFLGETVNLYGMLGIGLITAGGYLLHAQTASWSPLAPIVSLGRERGSRLMLLVALIFSFAAVIGKKAILHSSPLFFTASFFALFNLTVLLFLRPRQGLSLKTARNHAAKGIWLGGLFLVHVVSHALAIELGTAAYVIAVKRSSILLSLAFAAILFHEDRKVIRQLGGVVMFLGLCIITLWGS